MKIDTSVSVRLDKAEIQNNLKSAENTTTVNQVPKATKHYHVLNGLTGLYMPDNNDVYRTKQEANQGALFWVGQFRDQGDHFKGSLKQGAYYQTNGNYSIEIVPCFESECLKELDDQ